MATPEQRISYIEGHMVSMATKEDLALAKEDLAREIGALKVRLTGENQQAGFLDCREDSGHGGRWHESGNRRSRSCSSSARLGRQI